jgi:hypothetical protein
VSECNISQALYKTPPLTDRAVIAKLWLSKGWGVVPCQPNSKRLVMGFGPYRSKLEDASKIEYWLSFRNYNLAVIAPADGLILDFDDPDLYADFCVKCSEVAKSYTEATPGGGAHVFIQVVKQVPIEPVEGLELKRISVVYPSVVNGRRYDVVGGKIERVELPQALKNFGSVKLPPSPPVEAVRRSCGQIEPKMRPIEKSKQLWPIVTFLQFFAPRVQLRGTGRFMQALCPWHEDKRPSLWVDTERNLWGCHACDAHGDVIDWRCMQTGLGPGEVAKELIDYAGAVKVGL